jgi:hypothetical protein
MVCGMFIGMVDPTAAQNLCDALKAFAASAPSGHSAYDIAKDFQPFTAAMIAVFTAAAGAVVAYRAANLTYHGAVAKIDYDREAAQRERERLKLNAYVRLKSQLSRLVEDTSAKREQMPANILSAKASGDIFDTATVTWEKDLDIDDGFEELEKAWQNVDLFPETAIKPIDRLRSERAYVRRLVDRRISKTIEDGQISDIFAKLYVSHCETILHEAKDLITTLDQAQEGLKKID